MQCPLSTLVHNLSGTDKKETDNKFIGTMRSMTSSLSQSINEISQIDIEITKYFIYDLFTK